LEGANEMANYVYPAIFTEEAGGFSIRFPDFESCYTDAADEVEGLAMAKDVLCLTLYDMEKTGKEIPKPSNVKEVIHESNEFVTLISCDTEWYRRYYDSKSVKKTLSIPAWLNDLAEQNAINFSQVLQESLKEKLHVQ
jgi:predicted RNase H-like HicB family nuclease